MKLYALSRNQKLLVSIIWAFVCLLIGSWAREQEAAVLREGIGHASQVQPEPIALKGTVLFVSHEQALRYHASTYIFVALVLVTALAVLIYRHFVGPVSPNNSFKVDG